MIDNLGPARKRKVIVDERGSDFAVFDALPALLRAALNESTIKISAHEARRCLDRHGFARTIELIRETERSAV